jgi:hypothetical protein
VQQLVRASVEEAAATLVGPVTAPDDGQLGAAVQEVISCFYIVSKLLDSCAYE